MTSYSLSHLADRALLRELADSVSQDRSTTARMLAQIAEVDERRLYLPAGYSSMYLYCLHELTMSEDVAYKRIQAARAARCFPAIFPPVAEGRLHLTAVVLLAPHLAPHTAEDLVSAATHKTKAEIELLLAERFPKSDLPTILKALGPAAPSSAPAARPTDCVSPQLVPEPVGPPAGSSAAPGVQRVPTPAKLAPLAPDRFALQVTISGSARELLRQAQALLGHTVPSGDVAVVIERALEALVERLEKQKFAKCDRPSPQRIPANGRHIPAAVRRAVHERDGGQCTFVSESGKRCESRTRLEFDHVEAVARGGGATVPGIRLRCRAHNQYAADCTFGRTFMDSKRKEVMRGAAMTRARSAAGALAQSRAPS